jgi:hypothetical protein
MASGDWREIHSDLPRIKIAPFDDKPRAPPLNAPIRDPLG